MIFFFTFNLTFFSLIVLLPWILPILRYCHNDRLFRRWIKRIPLKSKPRPRFLDILTSISSCKSQHIPWQSSRGFFIWALMVRLLTWGWEDDLRFVCFHLSVWHINSAMVYDTYMTTTRFSLNQIGQASLIGTWFLAVIPTKAQIVLKITLHVL